MEVLEVIRKPYLLKETCKNGLCSVLPSWEWTIEPNGPMNRIMMLKCQRSAYWWNWLKFHSQKRVIGFNAHNSCKWNIVKSRLWNEQPEIRKFAKFEQYYYKNEKTQDTENAQRER